MLSVTHLHNQWLTARDPREREYYKSELLRAIDPNLATSDQERRAIRKAMKDLDAFKKVSSTFRDMTNASTLPSRGSAKKVVDHLLNEEKVVDGNQHLARLLKMSGIKGGLGGTGHTGTVVDFATKDDANAFVKFLRERGLGTSVGNISKLGGSYSLAIYW